MNAIQTLWFALPSYRGPFVIRGARLSGSGRIEVQPGAGALNPGSGPLLVGAGQPVNSSPEGTRTALGSTWVSSPGCDAWQVDGRGFSDVIVIIAVHPNRPGA